MLSSASFAISSFPIFYFGNPVAPYAFFLVFPSLLIILSISFLQKRDLEGSFYARCNKSSSPSFFLLYVGYSSPRLSIILHFSHDRSNRSSSSFFSTFPKFLVICDLLSKFLYYKKKYWKWVANSAIHWKFLQWIFNPSKYEAQTALFKDPVRTAL